MKGNKRVSKTLLYMFYCICLEECYWTPQQFARQFWISPDRRSSSRSRPRDRGISLGAGLLTHLPYFP